MFRDQLFEFPTAASRNPAIDEWFNERGELGAIARQWFDVMRSQGDDVCELLHDNHPTACAGHAAFGYVNVFTAHVGVGFFQGTELPDPLGLLQGTGKYMRHVKIRPAGVLDETALTNIIHLAYADVKERENR